MINSYWSLSLAFIYQPFVLNEPKITIFRNCTSPCPKPNTTSGASIFNLQRTLRYDPEGKTNMQKSNPRIRPSRQIMLLRENILIIGTCGELYEYTSGSRSNSKKQRRERFYPSGSSQMTDRVLWLENWCITIAFELTDAPIGLSQEKDENIPLGVMREQVSVRRFWPSAFYCAVPVYFAINASELSAGRFSFDLFFSSCMLWCLAINKTNCGFGYARRESNSNLVLPCTCTRRN